MANGKSIAERVLGLSFETRCEDALKVLRERQRLIEEISVHVAGSPTLQEAFGVMWEASLIRTSRYYGPDAVAVALQEMKPNLRAN